MFRITRSDGGRHRVVGENGGPPGTRGFSCQLGMAQRAGEMAGGRYGNLYGTGFTGLMKMSREVVMG